MASQVFVDQSNPYTETFFQENKESGTRSVGIVVPVLLDILAPYRPESVVDVGCGTGAWAAAWRALGVDDVLGIDGDYVIRSMLLIPEHQFLPMDLATPLRLDRRFDLAFCLEVGEHLPAERSGTLVQTLTGLSSLVVFSAAIPDQSGTHHVNEQWPDFWVARFREQGYAVADILRPRIWNLDGVDYWYRQNMLLFVERAHVAQYPSLAGSTSDHALPLVHPAQYADTIGSLRAAVDAFRNMGPKRYLSFAPGVARRALRRAVRRLLPA